MSLVDGIYLNHSAYYWNGISDIKHSTLNKDTHITNLVCRSTVCVEAIAKCEAIGPLKRAMTLRRDLLYSISETLHSLFERHHDNLVKQVNNTKT